MGAFVFDFGPQAFMIAPMATLMPDALVPIAMPPGLRAALTPRGESMI